jgi:hypothetical protein
MTVDLSKPFLADANSGWLVTSAADCPGEPTGIRQRGDGRSPWPDRCEAGGL